MDSCKAKRDYALFIVGVDCGWSFQSLVLLFFCLVCELSACPPLVCFIKSGMLAAEGRLDWDTRDGTVRRKVGEEKEVERSIRMEVKRE